MGKQMAVREDGRGPSSRTAICFSILFSHPDAPVVGGVDAGGVGEVGVVGPDRGVGFKGFVGDGDEARPGFVGLQRGHLFTA